MAEFLIIATVIIFLGVVALAYMGYKTKKAERKILDHYNSQNRKIRRKIDKAYRNNGKRRGK